MRSCSARKKPSSLSRSALKPLAGDLAERRAIDQEAGRGDVAAPDPAAQLVELGQTKTLGMLDDDDAGLRHVHADLDHGGGDEELRLAGGEGGHGGVLLGALHAAMDQPDARAEMRGEIGEPRLGGGEVGGLGFVHQRTDPIDPAPLAQRMAEPLHHLVQAFRGDGAGVDRLAARRLLAQLADIHVAEIGEHQRARDRRRRHHQHVDRLALGGEREALVHAEAVLLVDDGEREIAEGDALLEQCMGADQQVDLAGARARPGAGRGRCPSRAR